MTQPLTQTLCGRTIVDDYTENQQAPPVGTYNPQNADKYVDDQAPSYSLKSRIPPIERITQVGPASYNNRDAFNALQKEHPVVKFTSSARFEEAKNRSPGPCAYDALVPIQGVAFSMSSRNKTSKGDNFPAPNKYSNFSDVGGLKKTMSGRDVHFMNLFAKSTKETAGPGQYDVKDAMNNTNRGSFSFPKQTGGKGLPADVRKYNVSDAYNAINKTGSGGRSFGQRCKQGIFFK